MTGGYYGQGVPTSVDLENNSNSKKYTINESAPKGKLLISKVCCCLLAMGAIVLAALAALAVYMLLPVCAETTPEALTTQPKSILKEAVVANARLPRALEPTHYKIKLLPFLIENNFTTHGFISIEFKAKEPTDKIVLNVNDIDIDQDSLRVKIAKDGSFLQILDQAYNKEAQLYTIVISKKFKKDNDYRVEMNFVAKLNDHMQGFYRSSYYSNGTKRWMASTQFSPTDARTAFPCFDEPSFKAIFSITIGRPDNMTTLSNMPKKESFPSTEMEGYTWDVYKETPKMSTYLVAFIVSDLQAFEFNSSRIVFTIWTRKEAITQGLYASTIVPSVFNHFETYFNLKYPIPKVDLVAVPDFGFNAMENWGLITFRETALLLDPTISTIDDKRNIALVVAHEIAHQWFGNLATPKWWDDLWLKEGFATYFEYVAVDKVEPSWNITNEFTFSEMSAAFEIDSLASARPLSVKIESTNQIRQAFNKISYSKGASIIRMIQSILGEEIFKTGLIHFLNNHLYANGDHNDLWKALTEKAQAGGVLEPNVTVKDIMDPWTIQAGYPVVTAIADYEAKSINLSQKRYLKSGETDQDSLWWIPISYTTAADSKFDDVRPQAWLRNENETTIELNTKGWYLLNLKHSGYFIVNYDETNWKRLDENLIDLPNDVRAQLLSNALDLSRANLLDYDIPFRLLVTLNRLGWSKQLLTLTIALEKMDFLHNMLISTPAFNKFDRFILTLFSNVFDHTSFNEERNDSYAVQRTRRTILEWACKRPDSRCMITSRHLYRDWMVNGKPIAPNLKKLVYCTSIREGGEAEWEFAYRQYLNTTLASEKNTILDALGCSSKPWLLARYLDYMMQKESGIRKQDGERVFRAVANNIVGHQLAFDYLRFSWKSINKYYGVGFNIISKMVDALTMYMNTPYQLAQLEAFKNDNDLGTAQQAVENAIEIVRGHMRWMDKSYGSVEMWFAQHLHRYSF